MGTFSGDAFASHEPARLPTNIHHYFSNKSWIEGAALDQFEKMSRLPGVKSIAAFPDLHPGKYGATGVALLSEKLHPLLIGNDIGCGMSLFELDLPVRKLKLEKAASRLRRMDSAETDKGSLRLGDVDLPTDLFPHALGTIGGGNHFCELQAVESLLGDAEGAALDKQSSYLLVHSGSRGLGADVFSSIYAHVPDLVQGLDAVADAAV